MLLFPQPARERTYGIFKASFTDYHLFWRKIQGRAGRAGGRPMALYVHLVKITPQGASKIREASSTYETVRKFAESLGCKPLNVVACFGQYDYVGIWDCPNEVAALKLAGCAVSSGDVQVQTLPACKVEDFFKVMSELPR
jgi:uncharacterized protein with GYD domain